MKIYLKYLFLAVFSLLFLAACTGKKKDTVKNDKSENNRNTGDKKTSSGNGSLSNYDLSGAPKIIDLPSELTEISGITFTPQNRLFAHGDEYADIFEIDKETGKIIKKFTLGSILAVKGDFEDIAFVKDKFFLVESKGKLYEFSEGSNGEFVKYQTYKTFLSEKNDVEGLCFDNETNSLLLACKGYGGKELGKDKAVYTFSLDNLELEESPRFVISEKDIKNNTAEGKFHPSGIAKNPLSGTFYIIAARGNTIIEVSKTGEVLDQAELPKEFHRQPEGIAFTSDGTLYISNEGAGKTAVITVYKIR